MLEKLFLYLLPKYLIKFTLVFLSVIYAKKSLLTFKHSSTGETVMIYDDIITPNINGAIIQKCIRRIRFGI